MFTEEEKKVLRGQGDGCIRAIPLLIILEKYFGEGCLKEAKDVRADNSRKSLD